MASTATIQQQAPSLDTEGVDSETLKASRSGESPADYGVWERRKLPSGVQGGTPAKIEFCTI